MIQRRAIGLFSRYKCTCAYWKEITIELRFIFYDFYSCTSWQGGLMIQERTCGKNIVCWCHSNLRTYSYRLLLYCRKPMLTTYNKVLKCQEHIPNHFLYGSTQFGRENYFPSTNSSNRLNKRVILQGNKNNPNRRYFASESRRERYRYNQNSL